MIVLVAMMAAKAMRVSGSAPLGSEGRGRALGGGGRGSRWEGEIGRGGLLPPDPLPPWQLAFAVAVAVTVTAVRSVAAVVVGVVVSTVAVASGSGSSSGRG